MFYSEREFPLELDDVMFSLLNHIKKEGYVVVADINVRNILKNALNHDFKDYHILEVCKPTAAKEIIGKDDINGLFVPCKMIIYRDENVTKIKILKASEAAESLFPQATKVIEKYEKELFFLIETFSV